MLRTILYILLAILGLVLLLGVFGMRKFNTSWFKEKPNYTKFCTEYSSISFKWSGNQYGNYIEKHDAILIPVKIKGISLSMYMQFDTGAPHTVLNGKSLESLKKLGLSVEEIIQDETRYVKDFFFEMGANQIQVEQIKIIENYGTPFDSNDTLRRIKIGTIGADILADKITAIDFQQQQIHFYKERTSAMQALPTFQSFDFKGRRLMLPATIRGKKRKLFYDSGSSAFGLITAKSRYKKYTDKNVPEIKYDANSWGNSIPVTHKATDMKMEIGGLSLGLKRVSYVDMYPRVQGWIAPFSKIGGWLGNKPFTEHILFLDTKAEEFLVVEDFEF